MSAPRPRFRFVRLMTTVTCYRRSIKDLYFTFYPATNYTTTLNLAALELETF